MTTALQLVATEPIDKRMPVGNSAAAWAKQIARESMGAKCTSLGLTSGSRQPCDRRVIDALSRQISEQLTAARPETLMLVVRLNVFPSSSLERQDDQPASLPRTTQSPLGRWSEVNIPMPTGKRASWSLEKVPHWLPIWKSEFSFLLVDLGPMHLLPSRSIGRLCDSCYVLLGPDACASHEWILQNISWHDRCGSPICGTIVASS